MCVGLYVEVFGSFKDPKKVFFFKKKDDGGNSIGNQYLAEGDYNAKYIGRFSG